MSSLYSDLITSDRAEALKYELTEEERAEIIAEIGHYENPRAASIEALKIVQKRQGWVPDEAIPAVAEVLGIPASDVEGVATFYSQIFRQPVGRHIIRLCDSMVCFINGYETLRGKIKSELGIDVGQTTSDDRFTLIPVVCLGNCDKSPAMMVDDDTYSNLSPDNLMSVLEAYK
ncbi:NADH-quinone oxidoreductase subunit NuoE [Carnimonas nigrificans]|uniref:NADH-quinone oxidoreductase subunit NuoE n=1 Tax=Carnimonas nigrificans TaxID=64323 RepID=UPI00046F0CA8|nr:NADH-quinone oxidoreductase subunit NuoE [Carnimonas nigrificans]